MPWKRRAKRAPEPKSSSRPMIRSCAISSSAWFITGVPVSATRSASRRQRLGQPPHRLRALRARVLDVVRLVEHERPRLAQREPRAVRVHDVVVDDRDVGGGRDRAGARDDGDRAVREPVLRLALPVELQRRRADHDRGERVVLLQRRQRLDGLAEALLVGEERAPRAQHVARRRRAGTGAARRRAPPRSRSAGASWARERRTSSIAASCSARSRSSTSRAFGATSTPYVAQVVLERLDEVRVDRAASGRAPRTRAARGTRGSCRDPS